MATQREKGARFRALHERSGAFIIPNPWDAGSARILEALGFEALATSSAAAAAIRARKDHALGRDEALDNARQIVDATDVPVSADLGNGFGDSPQDVQSTIRAAAASGLVGCTIEDATGRSDRPLYELPLAVERIAAAAETARQLPFDFLVTARAHELLYDGSALDRVIERLQAFERAGADVLFAPGLPDLDAVRAVCASVSRPFNFMAGVKGRSFTFADLAAAGVKRVSVATSLYRASMQGFLDAAREIKERGTFDFLDGCVTTAELNALMHI